MSKGKNQGIRSKNVVAKSTRVGQNATKISPRGISQIGSNMGNHSTSRSGHLTKSVEPVRVGTKPSGGPGGIELGNQCALQSSGAKAGPGSGRTIYGQGGLQGTQDGALHPVKTQAKY